MNKNNKKKGYKSKVEKYLYPEIYKGKNGNIKGHVGTGFATEFLDNMRKQLSIK